MIKSYEQYITESSKTELKNIMHSVFEDLANEYSEYYEIDENFLTKLQNAITGYLDNVKRELHKPADYIKKIKNNIQNVKADIQKDIDLIKSKFKPRNKKEAEALADTVKDRYGYDEWPSQYQNEIDDYIDDII